MSRRVVICSRSTAMASAFSRQPALIKIGVQVVGNAAQAGQSSVASQETRIIQHNIELLMLFVLPALRVGDCFSHPGGRTPTLLGCLVQVIISQVLVTFHQKLTRLLAIVGNGFAAFAGS